MYKFVKNYCVKCRKHKICKNAIDATQYIWYNERGLKNPSAAKKTDFSYGFGSTPAAALYFFALFERAMTAGAIFLTPENLS